QRAEVAANPQCFAEVVSKAPDICAFGARHLDHKPRRVPFDKAKALDPHTTRGNGHWLPAAGGIVSATPADLDGREGWRHLLDIAYLARQRQVNLLARHLD